MGGLQVLVVQKDPKNDENIQKNVDFQYGFLSPKTYEKILILETPKINIKY